MITESYAIWAIIILLGIGTFLIRWSFLGLLGGRDMPDWALRHLRYTAVAVMPGLIAPMILWPDATGGEIDPARLSAAAAAVVAGVLTRNVVATFAAGMVALYLIQWLLG